MGAGHSADLDPRRDDPHPSGALAGSRSPGAPGGHGAGNAPSRDVNGAMSAGGAGAGAGAGGNGTGAGAGVSGGGAGAGGGATAATGAAAYCGRQRARERLGVAAGTGRALPLGVRTAKREIEVYFRDMAAHQLQREARRAKLDAMALPRVERMRRLREEVAREMEATRRKREGGCRVADFEFVRKIGQGSYGEVFLVRERGTRELYALKKIEKDAILKEKCVTHVWLERFVLASCGNQSFVCSMLASFQDRKYLYFLCEYLPGGDLLSMLIREDVLAEEWARFYIAEIIVALDALHRAGVIHRDVKPDNVIFGAAGHIRLADFGLSKSLLHVPPPGVVAPPPQQPEPPPYHRGTHLYHQHQQPQTTQAQYQMQSQQQYQHQNYHQHHHAVPEYAHDPQVHPQHYGVPQQQHHQQHNQQHPQQQQQLYQQQQQMLQMLHHPAPTHGALTPEYLDHVRMGAGARVDIPIEQRLAGWKAVSRLSVFSTVGTPNYIAPEVVQLRSYHESADWWSVGCILYEMLIGFPPFWAEDVQDTYTMIMNGSDHLVFPHYTDPTAKRISPAAEDLIRRLLVNDPNMRMGARRGLDEFKEHPFFFGVEWSKLQEQKPPFLPTLANETDTRYFDDEVTCQEIPPPGSDAGTSGNSGASASVANVVSNGTVAPDDDASFPSSSSSQRNLSVTCLLSPPPPLSEPLDSSRSAAFSQRDGTSGVGSSIDSTVRGLNQAAASVAPVGAAGTVPDATHRPWRDASDPMATSLSVEAPRDPTRRSLYAHRCVDPEFVGFTFIGPSFPSRRRLAKNANRPPTAVQGALVLDGGAAGVADCSTARVPRETFSRERDRDRDRDRGLVGDASAVSAAALGLGRTLDGEAPGRAAVSPPASSSSTATGSAGRQQATRNSTPHIVDGGTEDEDGAFSDEDSDDESFSTDSAEDDSDGDNRGMHMIDEIREVLADRNENSGGEEQVEESLEKHGEDALVGFVASRRDGRVDASDNGRGMALEPITTSSVLADVAGDGAANGQADVRIIPDRDRPRVSPIASSTSAALAPSTTRETTPIAGPQRDQPLPRSTRLSTAVPSSGEVGVAPRPGQTEEPRSSLPSADEVPTVVATPHSPTITLQAECQEDERLAADVYGTGDLERLFNSALLLPENEEESMDNIKERTAPPSPLVPHPGVGGGSMTPPPVNSESLPLPAPSMPRMASARFTSTVRPSHARRTDLSQQSLVRNAPFMSGPVSAVSGSVAGSMEAPSTVAALTLNAGGPETSASGSSSEALAGGLTDPTSASQRGVSGVEPWISNSRGPQSSSVGNPAVPSSLHVPGAMTIAPPAGSSNALPRPGHSRTHSARFVGSVRPTHARRTDASQTSIFSVSSPPIGPGDGAEMDRDFEALGIYPPGPATPVGSSGVPHALELVAAIAEAQKATSSRQGPRSPTFSNPGTPSPGVSCPVLPLSPPPESLTGHPSQVTPAVATVAGVGSGGLPDYRSASPLVRTVSGPSSLAQRSTGTLSASTPPVTTQFSSSTHIGERGGPNSQLPDSPLKSSPAIEVAGVGHDPRRVELRRSSPADAALTTVQAPSGLPSVPSRSSASIPVAREGVENDIHPGVSHVAKSAGRLDIGASALRGLQAEDSVVTVAGTSKVGPFASPLASDDSAESSALPSGRSAAVFSASDNVKSSGSDEE